MHGLIVKLEVQAGQREEVARTLLDLPDMPGCLSYVVARDAHDENALWITEVWESRQAHADSLALPAVKDAMQAAKPFVVAMSSRTEVEPLGGQGLLERGT